MALKAGYVGVKRWLYEKLQAMTTKNVQDISNIRSEQTALGARNLNATDYTKASALTNIVPTFNSDGSITVNGTTTAAETLAGGSAANFNAWYGGSVRIADAPADVTMALYDATAGANAGTAGQTVTMIAGHAYRLSVTFSANKTFTNVKVNPLIVIASDPTTEPSAYAMTNQQLTTDKVSKTLTSTDTAATIFSEYTKVSTCTAILNDLLVSLRLTSTSGAATSGAWTTIATLNEAYRPAGLVYEAAIDDAGNPFGWVRIHSDTGKVEVYHGAGSAKTVNISSLYLRSTSATVNRSLDAAPDTREASPEVIADDPEPVTKTTRKTTKKEDN